MRTIRWRVLWIAVIAAGRARAGVVINEIFYHAPNDLDNVQWVELYNDSDQSAEVSGWKLDRGKVYEFPTGTTLAAHGYVVVALDLEQFRKQYKLDALGPLKRPLKRGSERLELANASGERIDLARYQDHEPWPISADGYSASLERICPSAPGDSAENWAASPLPGGPARPAGTPGKSNASFSATLPPVVRLIGKAPEELAPDRPLQVQVEIKSLHPLGKMELFYRFVTEGVESKETPVTLAPGDKENLYQAVIPGQKAATLIRYRVKVSDTSGATRLCPPENELAPAWSAYVHDEWPKAKIPLGYLVHVKASGSKGGTPRGGGPRFFFPGFGGNQREVARPARGSCFFVHVDSDKGTMHLFDYVDAVVRDGERGFKLRFNKDNLFDNMSSVSLVFEGSERFLMAEALAYDVYRRAGNPASFTEFERLWVDGQMVGYHLLIERPNRTFLKRRHINPDGELYKIIWYGQGVEGQHEKKTHTQTGHGDLIETIRELDTRDKDAQWQAIQELFNVPEVATYFAVNMALSHWDGFHNNHFVYHDTQKTHKWELYPWDQDKTWGHHDGLPDDGVFYDMPLGFGREGDQPADFTIWWRPGGYFARPLLANPGFRKVFLGRTREILETVYTEQNYLPLIDAMVDQLGEDARLRAKLAGESPDQGTERLARNAESLRVHLKKRRQFLLEQAELRSATRPASK